MVRTYSRALTIFIGLLSGCGGNVILDDPTTTGAGGGAATSTSSTTDPPTTTATTSECGGKKGLTCPPGMWCNYPPDTVCGCCDMTGTCEIEPQDCPFDCPGVCGCDGNTYCNECEAHQAGVEVDPSVSCASPPPYALYILGDSPSHFVIFRTEGVTCTRVIFSISGLPAPYSADITMPWHIESAVITNTPTDCELGSDQLPVPAKDKVVVADTVTGTLKVDTVPSNLVCGADASLSLKFPPGGAWVPPEIPFISGYLSSGYPCDL